MKYVLLVSLPLYLLDRITKYFVLVNISPAETRIIIKNFFHIVNFTNTGAAFGSFKNNNEFFIVISCIALFIALILLLRTPVAALGSSDASQRPAHPRNAWHDVSLAVLIAGVLGNLTDRLLYGHVIDFLLFDLHLPLAHPWPAFNVADSCICVAVVCFVIHSFQHDRVEQRPDIR